MLHVFVKPQAGRGAGRGLCTVCAAWRPVVIEPERVAGQIAGEVAPFVPGPITAAGTLTFVVCGAS